MSGIRSLFKTFRNHWFAVEAVPLYIIVGSAGVGTAWYLTYLARRPEVLWARKSNPTPWNSVEQNQTTKLWYGHHRFDKSWKREKF